MYKQVKKAKENKNKATANSVSQSRSDNESTLEFVDNRLGSNNLTKQTNKAIQLYKEIHPLLNQKNYPKLKIKEGKKGELKQVIHGVELKRFFRSQVLNLDSSYGYYKTDKLKNKWMANIRKEVYAPLRVSDNGNMAIENIYGEAKTFYTTDAKIKKANDTFKKNKSQLRFKGRGEKLVFGKKILTQVEPYNLKSKSSEEFDLRTPNRCNEMADFASGETGLVSSGEKKKMEIIRNAVEKFGNSELLGDVEKCDEKFSKSGLEEDRIEANEARLKLNKEFLGIINSKKGKKVLKRFKLNNDMDIKLGRPISSWRLKVNDKNESRFGYHFAVVVAIDGDDYITIENYARGNSETLSSGDPLYFFKMYGKKKSNESWHDAELAGRTLGSNVLSFGL